MGSWVSSLAATFRFQPSGVVTMPGSSEATTPLSGGGPSAGGGASATGCTGAGGSPGSARANGAVTASAHTAVAAARLFSMGVAPLVLRCEEFEWVSFICQTALVIPM